MGGKDGILDGRQREGASLLSPPDLLEEIRSRGKPPGRVDMMAASVIQLVYAVRLLGKACDEGPLRTALLVAAGAAESLARDAAWNPQKARSTRRRRQPNDERALASEARDGSEDDSSASIGVSHDEE